jgi:calcineurin-like phosphoesterase family protein
MKITLNGDQRVFFTSDTHINHKNICRGTTEWAYSSEFRTRDFQNLEAMNSAIIDNINARVGQDDILFHLGDFSFGGHQNIPGFRQRIVCQNVHLIYGNHDEHIQKNTNDYQSLFSSVQHYLELEIVRSVHNILGGTRRYNFVLSHFPIASWNNIRKNWMHLHGHVHLEKGKRLGPGKMIDVGVDGNDLMPYDLSEIIYLLKDRPNKSLMSFDHHAD